MEFLFGWEHALKGFGLVLVRTSALILSAPLLGLGTSFAGYKVAIVLTVSFLLYVAVGSPVPADTGAIGLGLMAVREVLIGLFLGFLLSLVMLATRVAGDLIGHEMGFLMSRQMDPVTGGESTLIVTFYENLFLLALLVMNGHHWLLRALGESFERAPVGQVVLGGDLAPTFQRMFGEMFGAGIVFAAPVMVFLMLVSVTMGLLARAVPTLNVLELGFSMRVIVALGAMFLFAPLLEPALEHLLERFVGWLNTGLDALGAGG